jgi:hypothetical protein
MCGLPEYLFVFFGSFVATERGTLNGVTPKQDRLARQFGIPNTEVRTKTAEFSKFV